MYTKGEGGVGLLLPDLLMTLRLKATGGGLEPPCLDALNPVISVAVVKVVNGKGGGQTDAWPSEAVM